MFNRYSLGATVLAVFLLAIFGISRAFNWLRESPGTDTFADRGADRGAAVEDGPAANRGDDSFIEDDRIPIAPDGDQVLVSQSGDETDPSNDALSEEVLAPTPLETAGTYIQRQKGAEDQLIADSEVEATPLATDGIATDDDITAQTDTATDQPDSDERASAGSTAPVSQPVPALW